MVAMEFISSTKTKFLKNLWILIASSSSYNIQDTVKLCEDGKGTETCLLIYWTKLLAQHFKTKVKLKVSKSTYRILDLLDQNVSWMSSTMLKIIETIYKLTNFCFIWLYRCFSVAKITAQDVIYIE